MDSGSVRVTPEGQFLPNQDRVYGYTNQKVVSSLTERVLGRLLANRRSCGLNAAYGNPTGVKTRQGVSGFFRHLGIVTLRLPCFRIGSTSDE